MFAAGSPRLVPIATAVDIVQGVRAMFPDAPPAPPELGASTAAEAYAAGAEWLRAATAARPLLFGVFANQPAAEVNRIAESVGLDVIQLSGHEGLDAPAGAYCRPVIKAVHVADGDDAAALVAGLCGTTAPPHGVLLDTKSPAALGGTGEAFDWGIAADAQRSVPLFLAGGLGPENVAAAVSQVRPFGVDISSGVEASKGVKDPVRRCAARRILRGRSHAAGRPKCAASSVRPKGRTRPPAA